jgi:outer membrane protein
MKMHGKRFRMIVGALLLAGLGGPLAGVVYSQNTNTKIGSVDIHKAVNECNAGKEAKKALTSEVEKFQRLVADRQKELQDVKESLERQGPMLNPEARATKEKELQDKLRDFQRWGEDTQNEIKQKQMEMEKNIAVGLQNVIQQLAADEGYTLILERNENIVLFASKSTDITDLVIKAFNLQKK